MPERWPTARATNAVVHQRLCRPGRGNILRIGRISGPRQWLQEEARFYAQLQEMAGLTVWPGRANYLFLRCDRADFDLQYALLRQHVLIRSCANYPGLDSRYFRVAIRSAEENDQLLAALRRVLA